MGYYEHSDFEADWRRALPFTTTGRQHSTLMITARDREDTRKQVCGVVWLRGAQQLQLGALTALQQFSQ